jgi:two-component system response regulator DegU
VVNGLGVIGEAGMDKITVVVVDDHPMFRQGVIDALSLEPDICVLGDAANGDDALKIIRELKPMVAILDVSMPGMNGQQVTRQVNYEKLPTKVILVTGYDDDEQVTHSMLAGAAAYCAKDVRPDDLLHVIRYVVGGQYVIYTNVYNQIELEKWLKKSRPADWRPYSELEESKHPLSGREMEVLIYITKGLSNKGIATALGISHQTIKNHVTAILHKLGVEDRTQAAVYAIRRGWVRIEKKDVQSQE